MAVCLVTGGAGFIGSHLAEGLVERGHTVRIYDNLSTGFMDNLAGVDVQLIEADIRQYSALLKATAGVEWVFHLAAFVSVAESIERPKPCYDTNLAGSLNVLRAAYTAGAQRVVLASSAAVYGEAEHPVGEQAPKQPLSPYAASKLAMEQAARMFHAVYGLPTICLRCFNVYGPRQRPDSMYAAVIPAFIQALHDGHAPLIYGDGTQRRDFVYVDDVVRANLLAIEAETAGGQVFNIGGGRSVSVSELAGILHGFYTHALEPKHIEARPGDIYYSEASLDLAEEEMGYRPAVDMKDGLRTTVEWFGQHRQNAPA